MNVLRRPRLTPISPPGGAGKETKIAAGTSEFLDLSRWGASILVVLTHVRSLVLADYDHVLVSRNVAIKALYFVTNFGHAAVIIFFVISGYLVGGRTLISARLRGFSPIDYAIHRLVRIYTVLVPAIVLGFLLDWSGSRYFDDLGLYSHTGPFNISSLRFSAVDHLTIVTALGNLFQLQTVTVPPLGSNGPLWSLASEWWYYVIAGLGLAAAFSSKLSWRFVSACGAVLVIFALPLSITLGLIFWLMGACVAVFDQRLRGWPASVGLITLIIALTALRLLPSGANEVDVPSVAIGFLSDLIIAGAFSFALLCSKNGHWAGGRLNAWLASFSYTTYLVHFPAMLLLVSLFHHVFNFGVAEQPTLSAIMFAVAVTVVLYAYSFIFAHLTERHTGRVRALLNRVISAKIPGALIRTKPSPKAALH